MSLPLIDWKDLINIFEYNEDTFSRTKHTKQRVIKFSDTKFKKHSPDSVLNSIEIDRFSLEVLRVLLFVLVYGMNIERRRTIYYTTARNRNLRNKRKEMYQIKEEKGEM